jgi:hypothetical protein
MLFMLAADQAGGHAMGHGVAGEPFGFVPVVAMALTGYFAWHALRCADRCGRTPDPSQCARRGKRGRVALGANPLSLRTSHAGAVGDLVSAVAMSAMLLRMV